MVLADLGAQVLRIERPRARTGDPTPNPYDLLNRGRSPIGVDLRSAAGVELVRDLARDADVLIEGFRPGVAERLGVGPDELCGANPALVYGRMTGWGQEGPLAARAGHDLTYLAVAGALAHIGREGQPPTPPLNLVADFGGGGMLLAVGVLAALLERSRSGLGQVVDAAMVDGAALLMAPLFGAWSSGFWSAERGTNLLDSGAPFYDVYECADGGWLAVAAIEPQFFAVLVDGLELDPASLPDQDDRDRWPELRAAIAGAIRARTRDEWATRFADADACVAPVLTMGEAPSHPHAVARGAFVELGGVPHPAPAPRFDRTPADPPRATVEGADPAEVLRGWGAAEESIERWRASGALD
jgi:alpha-methylacyl-CoA racemase